MAREEEEESKEVILSNIYDSVVLKDIIMRNKVASPVVLEKILEYVVANSSTTISEKHIRERLTLLLQKERRNFMSRQRIFSAMSV